MTLIRWEPVPMNRFLNSFFDSATAQTAPVRRFSPATDLIESDTHYVLRADLPGVSEDDVELRIAGEAGGGFNRRALINRMNSELANDLGNLAQRSLSLVARNCAGRLPERAARSEAHAGGYHRLERSSGSFRRSVRLPEGVDGDAIEATFDRGVLEVSVPKPEQATPRKVQITVGAGAPAIDASDESAAAPQRTEPAAA